MGKNWIEVKEEIEQEVDRIWFEEPLEVTASKNGIYLSGAGANNTYIGNLFFQISDPQGIGPYIAEPAIYEALGDGEFTLEACKHLFRYLTEHTARLLGSKNEPACPFAWLNLPRIWIFYVDIVDSFDTIHSKEELKDLLWSWESYVTRICRWFHTVFPWEVPGQMTSGKISSVKQVQDLADFAEKVDQYMKG